MDTCSLAAHPARVKATDDIVVVMTDDQSRAQLGSHRDPVLRTPHLDRLAAESMEMTRFYVSLSTTSLTSREARVSMPARRETTSTPFPGAS